MHKSIYYMSLTVCLCVTESHAQLCFDQKSISHTLLNPDRVAFADLDLDGDIDIVASSLDLYGKISPESDQIILAWYENTQSPETVFIEHKISSPFFVDSFRVEDVDGDGHPDILFEAVGEIFWNLSDGGILPDFGFSFLVMPTPQFSLSNTLVIDIDGDGDLDLLPGGQDWYEFIGGGGSGFALRQFASAPAGAFRWSADLDSDGDIDLISIGGKWYESDGLSPPTLTEHDVHASAGSMLIPVDINNDGHMDLHSGASNWYRNSGAPDPVFDHRQVNGISATPLTPVDLDGDGDLDMIDNQNSYHLNLGGFDANFASRILYIDAHGEKIAGDFDRNGTIDVLLSDRWYSNEGDPLAFELGELDHLNIDLSAFGIEQTKFHDLDGDGDPDYVTADFSQNQLVWHKNLDILNLQSGFRSASLIEQISAAATSETLLVDEGLLSCQDNSKLEFFAPGVRIESRGDMVLPSTRPFGLSFLSTLSAAEGHGPSIYGSFTIAQEATIEGETCMLSGEEFRFSSDSVLNVSGDLLLRSEPRYAGPSGSQAIFLSGSGRARTGDIDGDGLADIVLSVFDNGERDLVWFKNDYQGIDHQDAFDETVRGLVDDPVGFDYFELADLNGDGRTDIVGFDSSVSSSILLLLNQGGTPPTTPMEMMPIGTGLVTARSLTLVSGDIDGDGDIDIAYNSGDQSGLTIQVMLNDGMNVPSFTNHTVYTGGDDIHFLALSDIDGDEDLDILMAGLSQDTEENVLWIENLGGVGDPSFVPHEISLPVNLAQFIAGGDMDGDGDTDIVVGSDLGITWHENDNLVFTMHEIDAFGHPGRAVVMDLDKDGDIDVMGNNSVVYINDGELEPAFGKQREFQRDQERVESALDFDNDGDADIVRLEMVGMSILRNHLEFELNMNDNGTESVIDVTGDVLVETANISLGNSMIASAGQIELSSDSSVLGSGTLQAVRVENAGSMTVLPGTTVQVDGDYQQYVDSKDQGIETGTLTIEVATAAQDPALVVTGNATLAGGLIIDGVTPKSLLHSDQLSVLSAATITSGFDVVSSPVFSIEQEGGEFLNGTLVPNGNAARLKNGSAALILEPVTINELFFSQNGFDAQGSPNDLVIADVTGSPTGSPDGVDDLIIAIPSIPTIAPQGAVAVLQGSITVNGYEIVGAYLYTGPEVDAPVAVEVGDFDGDSVPDIAFANRGDGLLNNDIHFLNADSSAGQPVFIGSIPAFPVVDGGLVTDLAVADVIPVGDGAVDLLVGIQGITDSRVVAAAFSSDSWESCEVDVDDIDTIEPIDSGLAVSGLAYSDLVYTSPSTNTATVLVNTGDFENAIGVTIGTGVHPTEVASEDLDGDGFEEIVVICEGSVSADGVITVVRNLGTGYAPPVNLPLTSDPLVAPEPASLALTDVDVDGDLDLVLVSVNESLTNSVRLIRNTTVGTSGLSFAAIQDSPDQPAGTPRIVRSSDLDGDSPLIADDLVVLVDTPGSLARGDGLSSIVLSGAPCPADVNNDGFLDFSDISVFVSAFGSGSPLADLNGDGEFDFIDISEFVASFSAGCP